MSRRPTLDPCSRYRWRPCGGISACAVAATLAASLGLALGGCSTPVLKSSVEVPGQFAASPGEQSEPEAAWWESFGDPVLSDLVRRSAHENRDIKIAAERVRAARAGETVSRSWLFPSIGVGAAGLAYDTGYGSPAKQAVPDIKAAGAGVDVSWEVDLSGRLRAGASAAAADAMAAQDSARGVRLLVMTDVATNYFTLVGALRQLETVRAISAAQDETLRLVSARQRAGLATSFDVERAQTDAARGTCSDTAAGDARRRVATPHRGAHRRSGVQRLPHRARERRGRRSGGSPRPARGAAATPAGPARLAGATGCRQCAPAAGQGGVFPAAVSGRSVRWPERGAQQLQRGHDAPSAWWPGCWRCRSSTRGARGRSTKSPRAVSPRR